MVFNAQVFIVNLLIINKIIKMFFYKKNNKIISIL